RYSVVDCHGRRACHGRCRADALFRSGTRRRGAAGRSAGTLAIRRRPRGHFLTSIRAGCRVSEFADESDLGLEVHAAPFLDHSLGERDEAANVLGRGVPEVDHDVRVHMRDLSVAESVPFESALVDEPAGADSLYLFEDRPGARMPFEPGMLAAAPAEV